MNFNQAETKIKECGGSIIEHYQGINGYAILWNDKETGKMMVTGGARGNLVNYDFSDLASAKKVFKQCIEESIFYL